jgi:hypothetical protein
MAFHRLIVSKTAGLVFLFSALVAVNAGHAATYTYTQDTDAGSCFSERNR